MGKPQAVILTHAGDNNPKLIGMGILVAVVGLIALGISAGLGAVLILVGVVMAIAGAQKRTIPCPHCRTRISQRAKVCPQCHELVSGSPTPVEVMRPTPVAYPRSVASTSARFCGNCGSSLV